ncbi:MAG: recombinase family protein [Janthinobacterium sp.]|jgi:site-specific DNA recombinase
MKHFSSVEKRVAIYVRVSTVEQADSGYSIDEQARLLREDCEKQGYSNITLYEDRGISGKSIKGRPGLMRLLQDVQDKKFDLVMVWKINRMARNLVDLLQMVDLLDKYDVAFKSFTEAMDTSTSSGKFYLSLLGMVGELERDTIAQNVKMGMVARAREGKWNGGTVLGYDLVNTQEMTKKGKSETRLEINEDEADIVREIFREYASGKGYKSISNALNHKGCVTKKGNAFSINGVREILLNPIYIGYIRYNVRENWAEKRRRGTNKNPIIVLGEHAPIIDQNLWELVQTLLSKSAGKPIQKYNNNYPLTGILKCPVCGSGMVLSRTTNTNKDGTKRRIEYYACGAWKNKGSSVCNSNSIRAEKANDYVFTKIKELIKNNDVLERVVKEINCQRNEQYADARTLYEQRDKQIEQFQKDKKKLSEKKDSILELYTDKRINRSEFTKMLDDVRCNEIKIEENMKLLESVEDVEILPPIPSEVVSDILLDFDTLLKTAATREQQKKLIHLLISEITINKNKKIDTITLDLNADLKEYLNSENGVSDKDAPFFIGVKNRNMNTLKIKVA